MEKQTGKQELEDFLLGGPGHDGYAYCADVYCVDCGKAIIEDLYSTNYDALESSDTNDSPQPIFFGESDCAEHCADCGEYLYGEQESDEDEDEDNDNEDN
jgi:hypothetical protein